MILSEQRLSEARRRHTEAIIAQHLHQLFQRLPMLSGFWLRPHLEVAELSVFSWPGYTAGRGLYEEVMRCSSGSPRSVPRPCRSCAGARLRERCSEGSEYLRAFLAPSYSE
jgi:hypothetical protein